MNNSINNREQPGSDSIETRREMPDAAVMHTRNNTSQRVGVTIEMAQLSHADRMAIVTDAMINMGGYSFNQDEEIR